MTNKFHLDSFGNEMRPAREPKENLMSLSVTELILTELMIMSTNIKEFFLKYEQKIVLVLAFCLISAISYQFGVLQGQKWQQKPLVIEKPSDTRDGQESANQGNLEAPVATKTATTTQIAVKAPITPNTAGCAYVGSKNSDKFYLPTCSYAKRVKPENLVCFKSAEEATGQGRTESKCAVAK